MPQDLSSVQHPVQRFIGFDVGKNSIVLRDTKDGRTLTIKNERTAIEAFIAARLDAGPDPVTLAVCEATGGYEALLLDILVERGIPAHRADAARVKAFIRSLGIHGKSDAIDAKALALYAEERHKRLTPWKSADKERLRLKALVERRADLVAMRTAERNRSKGPAVSADIQASLKAMLNALTRQIRAIEAQIKNLVKASPGLKQACATLQSQKGVGFVIAVTLLALMPELGTIDRKQAASLAGLAPHPRESGESKGYTRMRGGRPQIKSILFIAALSASRYDDKLKAFYIKLTQKGKKPIVALAAIMRKIIVISNARLRDHAIIQQS